MKQAFRCLNTVDPKVRPMRHGTEPRVKADIFCACSLTMSSGRCEKTLAPLLLDDEPLDESRKTCNPVLPTRLCKRMMKKRIHALFHRTAPKMPFTACFIFDDLQSSKMTACPCAAHRLVKNRDFHQPANHSANKKT